MWDIESPSEDLVVRTRRDLPHAVPSFSCAHIVDLEGDWGYTSVVGIICD